MEKQLRPFWHKHFSFDWQFGLFLILIICIPRFILVLIANSSGNYGSIGLIMTVSAIAPFVFLSKFGQSNVGITKPKNYRWLVVAFVAGLLASILLHFLGQFMYGSSYENWYTYIGKSFKIPEGINPTDRTIRFAISAFIGMTFSPIGEELFSEESSMRVL